MSTRASRRVLSAALLMTAPVQGQTPWGGGLSSPCLPYEPQNTVPLPGAQGFGRLVIAELDGDQACEGLVLVDGAAFVLWKITVYDVPQAVQFQSQPPPVSVADIATLSGAGPSGQDGVLMTDERGLFLVTHQLATPAPVFQDPTLIAGNVWADAAPIHVDDLDGDGEPDIVGIASDQRSILRCFADGPGGSGFQPAAPIPEPLDLLDVVPVDWDGDGERELIVLTRRGLLVLDAAGTILATVVHLSVTGCIARFRADDVAAGELLAWTRRASGGGSELVVLADGLQEGPWPLAFDLCGTQTSIEPTALLAGDYDLSGGDELLLAHDANLTAVVLANLGADEPPLSGPPGPHFDPASQWAHDIVSLGPTPFGPGGVGIPAFTQIDGDGPDDLGFPVSENPRVEVFVSLPYHRAIGGGQPNSAQIVAEETEFGPGPDHGTLRFGFEIPVRYASYTHIDMKVWRQPSASSSIEAGGLSNHRHPLRMDGEVVADRWQWIRVECDDFPPLGCWSEPRPYFYTEYRFAQVTETGTTLTPIFAGGFTLQIICSQYPPPPNEFMHLTIQGIPGTQFYLFDVNGLTGPTAQATSRELVGAYVPMSNLPPFDGLPDPPDQEVGDIASFFFGDQ